MAKRLKPKPKPKPRPAGKQRTNSEILKSHQFKPGQSGNPSGRPHGTSLTARLRKALNKNDGALAETVVMVLIREAAKGKFSHAKEILDRIDGSVVQRVQIEDAINNLLVVAERVLDAKSYGKLVFALAGGGDEGSDQDPAAEIRVH